MSCCGKVRAAQTPHHASSPNPNPSYFEYIGRTSMTVVGPITARRYHFPATGARLQVDARDRKGMLGVPNIREL